MKKLYLSNEDIDIYLETYNEKIKENSQNIIR